MENRSNGFTTGFVLGALAGGLAAFGAYKKREHLKAVWWKWEAKSDIRRRLSSLRELTRASYDQIVDDVVASYEAAGEVAGDELLAFAAELKRKYAHVKARLEKAAEEVE